VFHLDSLVANQAEPHELLDALLTHPVLADWLGEEYTELEYGAKLVPDSKKVAHPSPHQGRLMLVGDAAGQMQAQGPIIKGMNHAVTAGALAAEAVAESRHRSGQQAGDLYEQKLHDEGVMGKLRPPSYELSSAIGENERVTSFAESVLESPVGRAGLKIADKIGMLEKSFNSPLLMATLPDTRLPYVTMPRILAEELGEPVREENTIQPPDLADRIGDLTYDVGEPHIELQDNSYAASGAAVAACPVSAKDFGGGCYRDEKVETNGHEEHLVSLDTQPCVECGTCAIVADTDWDHPSGGKGVEFKQG
jgi:electron transfer flavoprotein-quinone oxidoreductase